MGIYLPNIEMPQDQEMLCVNIYPDGKVCINLDLECKRIATAVPVPPHGRLIDGNWLKAEIDRQEIHLIAAFDTLRVILDDATTIIPAEED